MWEESEMGKRVGGWEKERERRGEGGGEEEEEVLGTDGENTHRMVQHKHFFFLPSFTPLPCEVVPPLPYT